MRRRWRAVELAVFELQLTQPPAFTGVHAAVPVAPFVNAGIAEAVFAPDLLDWHASVGLLQKINDRFFVNAAWSECPSFPS